MPLRYAAKIGTGHTPDRTKPEYWRDCTVPWVTASDLSSRPEPFAPLLDTEQHVSELGLQHSAAVVHPAGTVMLCRTASVGLFVVTGRPMATTQAFVTWTPHASVLDSRYLLYTVAAMAPEWERLAYGSTHKTIYMPDLEGLRIPVPPLDEQRRIADFLDTETARLDALASLRERQRTLLTDELASLLEAAFVRPYDGSRVPLMHLTDPRRPIQYGIVLPGPDWPGGIPIIKGGDIAGRRLNPEELKRTDPEIERRFARSRVHGGDYVIAIRGSVGEIAPVPASLNGANLTQDSARIAPYDCDATWLGAVLRTPDLQNQMRQQTTGATIKGINISELRRLRVPTPLRGEQPGLGQRAAEHFQRSHAADEALRASVTLIRERRQALITAAVTGQLDVTTAHGIDTR